MSQLFDASGQLISPEPEIPERCPTCGSDKLSKTQAFGGYFKLHCVKCYMLVFSGRETLEEV